MKDRVPIEEAVKDDQLSKKEKRKLLLAQKARRFAEDTLKLKKTGNYSTYVKLDRPYVSWIVRAAPIYELKAHRWNFPFVGSVPYKGFFSQEEAEEETKKFKGDEWDTYVRGVTAYSTLGWFEDPILSTMLRYKDHDIVNLIIHETVHATIFIEDHADFNERLASFIGNKGTEIYYRNTEGEDSVTLKLIADEEHDNRLFSDFISEELKALKGWYKKQKGQLDRQKKAQRIHAIQQRFISEIQPQLKSKTYNYFAKAPLNNAMLLSYKTYMEDLSDFQRLYEKVGENFQELINYCKSLEDSKNPEKELKAYVNH